MDDPKLVPGWRTFDLQAVPKEKQPQFLARRRAVEMLLVEHKRPGQIRRETGIRSDLLRRLIDKAEAVGSDGFALGYEALLPHKVTDYQRTSSENTDALRGLGKAGLFQKLLADHPENIAAWIEDVFFNGIKRPNGQRKRVKRREMHSLFLARCSEVKIPPTSYPFNTDSKASRSLYRHLEELEAKKQGKYLADTAGSEAAIAFLTDSKGEPRNKPARLFERVQIDGHELHAAGVVEVPTYSGMPLLIPLFDVWIVDMVDRANTIALGHCLCLTGNYNRYDVQRCIASANGYRDAHDGIQNYLPVHFIPELAWAAFDDVELDRALAHRAGEVHYVCQDVYNARVRFGEAGKSRKRPQVEYVFHELESRGISRLPSSLKPHDGKASRNTALKLAEKHRITYRDLEEICRRSHLNRLLDPRSRYEGRSQLDYLKWYSAQYGQSMRRVPRELQFESNVLRLVAEATIVGDPESGRRPHINWMYGDYRGDIISRSRLHLGKRVKIVGNPNDVRHFSVYIGSEMIDTVFVQSPWAMRPHSVETRRRAATFFRQAGVKVTDLHDAISGYEQEMYRRGRGEKLTVKDAKEIARMQREASSHPPSESPVVTVIATQQSAYGDIRIRPGRKAINQ